MARVRYLHSNPPTCTLADAARNRSEKDFDFWSAVSAPSCSVGFLLVMLRNAEAAKRTEETKKKEMC